MNEWRAEAEKRERELEKYFDERERERLISKGFKLPAIYHNNLARAIAECSTNRLEKEFCKTIMTAFKDQLPLHPGTLKNLRRLAEKHCIVTIKLQVHGKD